jgi:plasmid stabilization system protein ParE
MPQVIITDAARAGLQRCRKFLAAKDMEASKRAAAAIGGQFSALQTAPEIGRPFPNDPHLRELLIPFGDSGYVALYVHDRVQDQIIVLAFRHQREAGY